MVLEMFEGRYQELRACVLCMMTKCSSETETAHLDRQAISGSVTVQNRGLLGVFAPQLQCKQWSHRTDLRTTTTTTDIQLSLEMVSSMTALTSLCIEWIQVVLAAAGITEATFLNMVTFLNTVAESLQPLEQLWQLRLAAGSIDFHTRGFESLGEDTGPFEALMQQLDTLEVNSGLAPVILLCGGIFPVLSLDCSLRDLGYKPVVAVERGSEAAAKVTKSVPWDVCLAKFTG